MTLTGDFTSGNTYYFVVAPGTLNNGLTLTLYDNNGNGYIRSSNKSTSLTAGHILNLGEINATSFDSYSKITIHTTFSTLPVWKNGQSRATV